MCFTNSCLSKLLTDSYSRYSGLDFLPSLNNACILFAKASTHIAVVLRYNIEPTQAIESIVETTFFLIHLLISLYDRAVDLMFDTQQIEYFVLSTHARWFDEILSDLIFNAGFFRTDNFNFMRLLCALQVPFLTYVESLTSIVS